MQGVGVAVLFHRVNAGERFERADEDGADVAFVRRDIEAVVHAVDEVDVPSSVRAQHDFGTGRERVAVACGVALVRFGLDDHAGAAVVLDDASEQVLCYVKGVARAECCGEGVHGIGARNFLDKHYGVLGGMCTFEVFEGGFVDICNGVVGQDGSAIICAFAGTYEVGGEADVPSALYVPLIVADECASLYAQAVFLYCAFDKAGVWFFARALVGKRFSASVRAEIESVDSDSFVCIFSNDACKYIRDLLAGQASAGNPWLAGYDDEFVSGFLCSPKAIESVFVHDVVSRDFFGVSVIIDECSVFVEEECGRAFHAEDGVGQVAVHLCPDRID